MPSFLQPRSSSSFIAIVAVAALTARCGESPPTGGAMGGDERTAGGGGRSGSNTPGATGGSEAGNGTAGLGDGGTGELGGGAGTLTAVQPVMDAGRGGGLGTEGGTAAGIGPMRCGSTTVAFNPNPFGCQFAWGASVNGSLSSYSYLQFATFWIEGAIKADGTFGTCSGCNWVKSSFNSTNAIPVYYAYIIGFLGHANGLTDGNTCPSGQPNCPNLTNQGATLIKNNRTKIIDAYASYAEQTHAAWPTKPLVWLLEGDFVQYSGTSQTAPLTPAELAQLAADITCAIKAKMPNAVVAIDHSSWNPNQVTDDFWNAMKNAGVPYDMAWTTGVANNNGFISAGTGPTSYNGMTATYAYLHKLTNRTIWVDDSCGVSAMADTWSTSSASTLNGLIASGVIAFSHCSNLAANFQSAISALEPQLSSTCQ